MTEFEVKITVTEVTGNMFKKGAFAEHKWSRKSDWNAEKILHNVLKDGDKAEF